MELSDLRSSLDTTRNEINTLRGEREREGGGREGGREGGMERRMIAKYKRNKHNIISNYQINSKTHKQTSEPI